MRRHYLFQSLPRVVLGGFFLVLLCVFQSPTARAADKEFDAVTRYLNTYYHAKRIKIPFMGLANFALKIVRPAGVSSVKVATFENVALKEGVTDPQPLEQVLSSALSADWERLAYIRERGGAQTLVYFRADGKSNVKIFVATISAGEATVARVKMNYKTFIRWLERRENLDLNF